ncbi:MAG TPA: hypothetical protein VET87_19835 [Rubrivivax sp.]|nr:hypothetical protein [Rubrivivax sp.]
MKHADPAPMSPLKRWLVRLICVLAALVGMVYSYDFGKVIGGPLIGVVLALNGAVFCSIVAGALAEKLCQWWPQTLRETGRSAG